MTHGEDAGPETHQDSAVLTYLEGLLMHPVATGPGATATRRSEADRSSDEEQRRNHAAAQGQPLANHAGPAAREKTSPPGGASQHLKKARLLRSGAWGGAEDGQRRTPSTVNVNGQGGEHQQQQPHRAGQDGSPLGESTLLASLLTTFSSRLQGVALSQQLAQSQKQPEARNGGKSSPDERCGSEVTATTFQGYGTASSRLKGLVRNSKAQNHNTSVPYSRRGSQDRASESPRAKASAAVQQLSPSDSSVSCAERLKAVANLVKTRSSPAPSPRPSMACSQLALLLSSEAHLQQYSREQALKAQLAGQSASERLAAMASQMSQDPRRPPSVGEAHMGSDMLNSLNGQHRSSPQAPANSAKGSPSPGSAHSGGSSSLHTSPQPQRERRHFDRHASRPPQNCSSLLLLLLNNHNSQKQLTKNGHMEEEEEEEEEEEVEEEEKYVPPIRAPSLQLDSQASDQYRSPTKSSSDADSYYSSCSPIDLSMRTRVSSHESAPPSASSSSSSSSCPLDKLTETLINKWKPDTPGPKVYEAGKLDISPDAKSHHKVTLMQLLLDRRNNEKVNKIGDNPDLLRDSALSNTDPLKLRGTSYEESHRQSPVDCRAGRPVATFSLGGDTSGSPSPYSFSSPQAQSSPLDLCKSKPSYSSEQAAEPGFSASKLLQNLAQCGLTNVSPAPSLSRRPSKRPSPALASDKPSALLERLNPPAQKTGTPVVDPPYSSFPSHRRELSASPATSQIESLLERRTVLQLLLGSASHAEKPSGMRITEAPGAHESHSAPDIRDGSNGPSLDIKIKTEPGEESHLSGPSDNESGVHYWNNGPYDRHGPFFEQQGDVKSEPCPADIVSKYGLLSQLLKQQTSTYNPGTPTDSDSKSVKEEQQDYHGGPSPKRRRLCMELAEQLTSELCSRPVDSYEGLNGKLLLSPKEEESPARSPVSKVLPRDHQGFNVLKQLLLSDNCLKGLSQGGVVTSPRLPPHAKVNGNLLHQPHYNHRLSQLPWQPVSSSPGPAGTSAPWQSSGNGFHEPLWNKAAPATSPGLVKKELESPSQKEEGNGREEERRDSSPDSPRLTRANPILYYMLQRGKGELRREARDQSQVTHCEIKVKEEPKADDK